MKLIGLLLFFLNVNFAYAIDDFTNVCGNYYLKKEKLLFGLDFTDNEKIFICGDDTPGWKDITDTQARASIKNFLAARGYFQTNIKYKNRKYYIYPGKKSEIKYVDFIDAPSRFFDLKYKIIKGLTLNKSNLDEIASWVKNRLRAIGYPCPHLKITTSYAEEKIKIYLKPGEKTVIKKVIRPQLEQLSSSALSRYDAFGIGDSYNGDYLNLTSSRLIASGLVDFSHFKSSCETKGLPLGHLQQEALVSKPNYLVLAAGASTEEQYLFKSSWQYTRLNKQASSISAEAYLSPRKQAINTKMKIYLFDQIPRFHLSPQIKFEKLFEDTQEGLYQTADLGFNYFHDSTHNQFAVKVAPTYTIEQIDFGTAPRDSEYLSIVTTARITSHYFEYYRASPRTGFEMMLSWSTQKEGFQSDFDGNLLRLSGTHLFNVTKLSPPQFILGLRYDLATLITNDLTEAPQRYRLYLGGDANVRGFNRQSINNRNQGFLTTSYLGVEPRFTGVLPFNLQPYLLVDVAKVGLQTFDWENEQIWSAGLGLRWPTSFGVFRGTISQGFVTNRTSTTYDLPEDGINSYLSFGREF